MKTSRARYSWLLTTQAIGSAALLSQCYPLYTRLLDDPGHVQVYADTPMVAVIVLSVTLVQGAHWYRVFKVPLPVRDTHVVSGQLVLFVSRLAFIIASALFSLVLFRHLPEIDFGLHGNGFVWRGLLLLAVLFSVSASLPNWNVSAWPSEVRSKRQTTTTMPDIETD